MTRTLCIILAAGGSAALVAGAFAFQYIGGLAPCHLCWLQRYPHMAAVAIGVLALAIRGPAMPLLGALAALTTAVLGGYHTGVERHWWEGPSTCTSGSIANLTPDQLLNQINAAPLVQCDQVAWSMFGISMASWNMLLSLVLVGLWIAAARKSVAAAA